ncbi:hypothetical protein FB15_03037 [Listeria monocytogenes]|uniref:hypothetical protein n=1 Tax=Listeria monocytogenes TaxID=1639 RepID=UPI000E70A916|nr:hypothetical protein [Listeria monocytogenes]RKB93633.1 hypothetical protein FB15_03037 [Listeria monocytogenes]
MKQGQWMLNGSYGGRWESITYFYTKDEAIEHGINSFFYTHLTLPTASSLCTSRADPRLNKKPT